jgi:MoaA/NifB/PqqE/SkfB family radical SAM enzyme
VKVRLGPSGIHLFDRNSGLNLLVDEIAPSRESWATAPRHVSIGLTNACDLTCSYCFAPKHAAKLDFERLTGWMDELDGNSCLGVGFGGGEPTLHPEIESICKYGAQRTGLAITMTTHAHRLSERLAAALTGNIHFLRVSMDGVGSTYERLRGRSFDSLLDRLRLVRSVSRFGINFVVNAETLPDLDRAITIASEARASEFLLLPERPSRNHTGIDHHTMDSLRKWVRQYRKSLPLLVSDHEAEELPICGAFLNEDPLYGYVHISASGVLMRSSFDTSGVRIGEGGLMEALQELRNTGRSGRDEDLVELRF